MKTQTLEELENKHIGVTGTPRRNAYEARLNADLHLLLCKEYQILLYKETEDCTHEELGLKVSVELILEDLYKKQNNPMD